MQTASGESVTEFHHQKLKAAMTLFLPDNGDAVVVEVPTGVSGAEND